MPKTKISEFSATPANNTDIDSINIAEGCAPSGINDAIRELMAQLKDFQTGAVGDSFNGPVGTSTAAAGAFTTLSASSTVSGTGFSTYLASPPAIGGTAAAAGAFTTLTASGNVTLSGGTANGVAYLNGSKVVTSGSALTFNGSSLGVGIATPTFADGTGVHINNAVGSARLHLTSQTSGSASTDGSEFTVAGSDLYIINNESAATIFYNAGSEQMRLTSTGLGIGTSSPATKLHVYSTSARPITAGNASATWTFGPTSTSFAFRENSSGSDFLTIDSSGNLGLGVTPSATSGGKSFEIAYVGSSVMSTAAGQMNMTANVYYNSGWKYAGTGTALLYQQSGTGVHAWYNAASGTAGNAISWTQAMTLDASGQLGVGTTTPDIFGRFYTRSFGFSSSGSTVLQVNGGSGSYGAVDMGAAGVRCGSVLASASAVNLSTHTSIPIVFITNDVERARIDSSGNLLVGTTSQTGKLAVNGDATSASLVTFYSSTAGDVGQAGLLIGKQDNNTTTSQVILRATILSTGAGAGQINMNGANSLAFGTYSDQRLKENIVDLPSQLSNILALHPVEFDYIESEGGGHQTGFIAQEMQAVYPDAVGEREDGMLTVSGWSKTEARLVKAIQEQQAIIESLKARLDAANL